MRTIENHACNLLGSLVSLVWKKKLLNSNTQFFARPNPHPLADQLNCISENSHCNEAVEVSSLAAAEPQEIPQIPAGFEHFEGMLFQYGILERGHRDILSLSFE